MSCKETIEFWNTLGLTKRKVKKEEPKPLSMETIKAINSRIEQDALDYDIPYPSGGELREWQLRIMQNKIEIGRASCRERV